MLADKVILLTGGTQGIGHECAKAYLKGGARLVIVSNDEDSIFSSRKLLQNDDVLYFSGDVSIETEVQEAVTQTLRRFGRIDAVHNNAGIAIPAKVLDQTSEEEWNLLMNVNLKSVYYFTKHAIEALISTKGCILNTSSLVGEIGQERHAAYVATKGAVNALTKAMALDYAAHGVRVNAIAPAAVRTPALQKWSDEQINLDSIEKYLNGLHPIGYCPDGDVIADVCVFLLSDKARFITGCILPVSGGAELGYRRSLSTSVTCI